MSNIHRDTYAAMAGNTAFALYYSVATNECQSLVKTQFIEVCLPG